MNRYITTTFIVIALTLLTITASISPIFAQEADTTTSETTAEPIDDSVDDLEEDLLLLLPEDTDNPNLTIAFNDPSGKGVQLKIDGQEYKAIESPYILPSLSIGQHYLSFKYTDSEEVEKEVERALIIVPRSPVVNPPDEYSNNKLVISGMAIPLGKVEIFLSGGTDSFRQVTDVDTAGVWEYIFEQEFKPNVYSVVAFAKKDGYASTFADPVVFSIDEEVTETEEENEDGMIFFDFSLINRGNVVSIIENNPHIGLLTIGAVVLGFLFGFILTRISWFRGRKSSERQFMNYLKGSLGSSKQENPKESKKSTKEEKKAKKDIQETKGESDLKSKFVAAGFKAAENSPSDKEKSKDSDNFESDESEIDIPKESTTSEDQNSEDIKQPIEKESVDADVVESEKAESPEPKKNKESEMTKEEFLAKYKEHDPDQEKKSNSKSAKSARKVETTKTTAQKDKDLDKEENAASDEPESVKTDKKSETKTTTSDKPEKQTTDQKQSVVKETDTKEKASAEERKKQIEKSIKITLTSDSIGE